MVAAASLSHRVRRYQQITANQRAPSVTAAVRRLPDGRGGAKVGRVPVCAGWRHAARLHAPRRLPGSLGARLRRGASIHNRSTYSSYPQAESFVGIEGVGVIDGQAVPAFGAAVMRASHAPQLGCGVQRGGKQARAQVVDARQRVVRRRVPPAPGRVRQLQPRHGADRAAHVPAQPRRSPT